jgi:hypothetical protein
MPVVERRISGEVRGDLAEAGRQGWLSSRTADAGFGVANDASRAIDCAGRDEGLDSEVRGGRVTTRIRDQLRPPNSCAAKFGQAVDCAWEQIWRGVRFFVPTRVGSGIGEPKRSAEIYDLSARIEHSGGELHGNVSRGCKEDHVEPFGFRRFGRARHPRDLLGANGFGPIFGIAAMFEEDWLDMRMVGEQAEQFRATIASETDDSGALRHWLFIHRYE